MVRVTEPRLSSKRPPESMLVARRTSGEKREEKTKRLDDDAEMEARESEMS